MVLPSTNTLGGTLWHAYPWEVLNVARFTRCGVPVSVSYLMWHVLSQAHLVLNVLPGL